MSPQKFHLSWNNFHDIVINSYELLRSEKEFFDVTLVSEDGEQIEAHKLVLAACSPFFKDILRKSPHSHPLLYMNGIQSGELSMIMDYIYHGKVQILEDKILSFVKVAQKLKLDGMDKYSNPGEILKTELKAENDSPGKLVSEISENGDCIQEESDKLFQGKIQTVRKRNPKFEIVANFSHVESKNLNKHLFDFIEKDSAGLFTCKVCGSNAKRKSYALDHAEVHIDCISFPCRFCENTSRTRNGLRWHMQKYHKQEHLEKEPENKPSIGTKRETESLKLLSI